MVFVRALPALLALALLLGPSAPASSTPFEGPRDGLAPDADQLLLAGRSVPLILAGVPHTLHAVPHTLLSDDAQVGTYTDAGTRDHPVATTTYRGITEASGLGIRLSLDPDQRGVEGLVLAMDGTSWLLVPRPDGGADAVPTLGLHRHGIGAHDALVPPAAPVEDRVYDQDGTLTLRLAIEVNHNYWRPNQDRWAARILEIVSYTELIYTTQLDVVFEVTFLMGWESADPYTAPHACWPAVDPGADGRLEQFAQYWQQNRQGVERDAAHLFVSGFASGSFTGCAYIEALGQYGYGVSQAKHSIMTSREATLWDNINLFAHELGHNFGGLHEKSVGLYGVTGNSALYGVPPHTIMDTGWNGVLRFSDLNGVHSPSTGYELDNAGTMRAHAETRLGSA